MGSKAQGKGEFPEPIQGLIVFFGQVHQLLEFPHPFLEVPIVGRLSKGEVPVVEVLHVHCGYFHDHWFKVFPIKLQPIFERFSIVGPQGGNDLFGREKGKSIRKQAPFSAFWGPWRPENWTLPVKIHLPRRWLWLAPKGVLKSRFVVVGPQHFSPPSLDISHIVLSFLHQAQWCSQNIHGPKNDCPNRASASIWDNS